jgi:HSP20 family molecular chaperone IbpA
VPQIEVTFDIDANGIVHVSAKDLGTGKEQKIRIESSSGLGPDDIKKMVRDAEAHSSEDKKARELADVKNAENLVYSTEKSLRDMGDKVDASTRAEIEAAAAEVKSALEGDDQEAIQAKTDTLMQASHKLAEAVYQQAQQQQGPGGGDGSGAASDDENVEEGDYEVIDEDEAKVRRRGGVDHGDHQMGPVPRDDPGPNQFNRLVDQVWGRPPRLAASSRRVREKDAVVLKAELAGLDPNDIEIEVDDNVLTIKGERKFEEKVDEERYYRVERRYGSFSRSLALPQGVRADDIQADYEDGVLRYRTEGRREKPSDRSRPERRSRPEVGGRGHSETHPDRRDGHRPPPRRDSSRIRRPRGSHSVEQRRTLTDRGLHDEEGPEIAKAAETEATEAAEVPEARPPRRGRPARRMPRTRPASSPRPRPSATPTSTSCSA